MGFDPEEKNEQREYFRVDDVLQVDCVRRADEGPRKRARIFAGIGTPAELSGEPGDETVSPGLWRMLVDINNKLSLILQHLQLQKDGAADAEHKAVNLSGCGIRFTMTEPVIKGDSVEMKLILPTMPPIGILAYGDIVRVKDAGKGEYDVAVHFTEMDDEVRDEIIQYALNRQREQLKARRQQSGNND